VAHAAHAAANPDRWRFTKLLRSHVGVIAPRVPDD